MLGFAAGIDEEIVAVASYSVLDSIPSVVFVFNISTNPTQQLAVLSSPEGPDDAFGKTTVAVNRKYGVLVGAALSTLEERFPLLLLN